MGTGLGDASYRINLCAPAPMSYADRLFINGGFSIYTVSYIERWLLQTWVEHFYTVLSGIVERSS